MVDAQQVGFGKSQKYERVLIDLNAFNAQFLQFIASICFIHLIHAFSVPVAEPSRSSNDHPEGTHNSHGEGRTQQPPIRAHFLLFVCP